MKLLAPKERASLKQQEEERLVREETALSGKVDSLRELEQSEKKKLQEFQEREFEKYLRNKEEREAKLSRLDNEISKKTARRAKLMEPIDKERHTLEADKKAIEELKLENDKLSAANEMSRIENKKKSDLLDSKEKEIKRKEIQATRSLSISEKNLENSKTILASAQEESKKILEEAEEIRNSAKTIEQIAEHNMHDFNLKNANLEYREKDLEQREILLKDRNAMLERNIIRFKK